ncbi:MAG: redoxin domain-containing protein [Gemmatimonadales bacterium]|nr:MAG: redoxin domain-containing protein [Gemmatimonadales bacterium]
MALAVGTEAPDFSLPPGPGPDRVTLSAFRGEDNVVLLFFPMAFSSVCTDEMCQMAESYSRWGGLDAQVLGVSVDSPFVVQKFKQETGAQFPMLSDFNKEAIHAFDVVYEDFYGARGVGKRSVFVIDREGVIQYVWVTEDAGVIPDFEEIRNVVEALS